MVIVDTYDKFTQAMEWLHGQETVAYDIETTGLNVRRNVVIGFGVSTGTDGFYVPLLVHVGDGRLEETGPGYNCVEEMLKVLKTKKLLCWNASFDLRFTKNRLFIDLLPALHADVMLLKHTVDEEFPFGLKEVGVKVYGQEAVQEQEELKASIKKNGGTAKQYYKADTEVLAKYCVKDAMLTCRLYSHFSKELKVQALEDFFYRDEVMPLYKEVTIPMEESGIQLDVPLLFKTQQEITEDLRIIEQGIQDAIIPHLGIFTTWFLNKDYPLQTYTGKTPLWKTIHLTQQEAWSADYPDNYMFNLQSKHHLKKLFFDTLKETPLSRTPTGQPQVNEEFLDKMALKYDWCKRLIEFNKLTKIKTAYIDRLLEEQEEGIYYASFMQHRTVSGRYGSDIQQLPRTIDSSSGELVARYNNLVRKFIIARPGHKLVAADYSQLEPRVFAHVSGDDALKDIFNNPGNDFYSIIAQRTEGLTTVSKEARQKAKAYALGIPYGLTGYKLKFEIGCTQEQGDKLVNDYLNAFPALREWMRTSKLKAQHLGYIKTQTGRVRHLGRIKEIREEYGAVIEDDLELWKKFNDYPEVYAKAKLARKEYKNLLNNAMNFQIQGLAASIMNRAAIAYARSLDKNSSTRIIAQVHDELLIETQIPHYEGGVLSYWMEHTTPLSVPLPVVSKVGDSYDQCK